MRCLLLAVVAGLAVLSVQIRAEDVAIVDDFEIDDSTLRQMLGDLFEFDESDDDLGSDREARARGDDVTGAEEEKAIAVDPKEQLRYNSFIDTFLRRLNSFARSRFDPLSVGLGKKGKSSSKGGKAKKGKNAKSGNRKGKKAGKKGKKGENNKGRHPKDLDLDEIVQEEQAAVVDVEEEQEVHEVEKREAEFEVVEIEEEEEETDLEEEEDEAEEDSLVRVARDADEETDDSPMEETSRRVKPPKGGKKGAAKKGRKKGGKKGKGKKKSGKKGGKKSGKKSGKKGRTGGKKRGGHPKDLDLDEVVQEGEGEAVVDVEEKEEEGHEVEKREAELEVIEIEEEEEEEDEAEEESLVRVARDAEEETGDSPMEETSRKGKPAKGRKKSATKKGGKKSGKKGKGKKKSGKKGGKKSGKKSGNKSKRSSKNKSGPRTSRADVSGIATLRRDGDVLVRNRKGGKEMRATFTMGPVQLKVNRKFGTGKKAISREAAALSPELTGKLAIAVAANGKARMTNFRINRPAIVQVQGTLAKTAQGGKSNNNFMENSIGRFSPIASKKLKIASREILSAGEPKANADN